MPSSTYDRRPTVIGGRYLRFFVAAILASLLLQVTIVTDTVIVGRLLGQVPMTGIRVASPIINLLGVISTLIGIGGSTVTTIAMGKRDRETADASFTLTIALSVAAGLVFALVVAPLADTIARLISSSAETVAYTAAFMRIVAMGSPAYILASVMAVLLRADSNVKLSSAVLAVAGLTNVGFDLLFMGVAGMGVEGSALATVMGMLAAVLVSLLYLRWPRRTLRFRAIAVREVPQRVAAIFRNGGTASARMLFACLSLLFLNYVVGQTAGVDGIALLTVCGNIQLLAVAFFSAGGQAAMPIEGVLFGERDFGGIRLLVAFVLRVILGCVLALVVLVWLFPAQIVSLFVPAGIDGSASLLRLYAVGFVPMAVNYILLYHYNTVQRRAMAMVLTLCENLVLYLPLIWLLTRGLGVAGAVVAFVATESATLAITLAVASLIKAREGLATPLLLPEAPRETVYEATVPATDADASGIARNVKAVLDGRAIAPTVSVRAAMGVEEMVALVASYAPNVGRDVLIDVRVSALENCVQISMRDNGSPLDPTLGAPGEPDEGDAAEASDNMRALRAVATSVEYRHTLGLNLTIIEIREGTRHA